MNLLEFLEKKPINLLETVIYSTKKSEVDIVDAQKEQWGRGQDANGNPTKAYKIDYTDVFGRVNKIGTPRRIFYNGNFYSRTNTEVNRLANNINIIIDSDTNYTDRVINDMGNEIFGLQPANMDKVVQIINDKTIEKINKHYGM